MSFLFSVIIIPDCHLTAFILDTVGALIKNTLFKEKKPRLSFCLSSLWLPPDPFAYLKKKKKSWRRLAFRGTWGWCVRSLYLLSSISRYSGRTICLLLSVGRDGLNGMGWSLQGVLSPQNYRGQRTGLRHDNIRWTWSLTEHPDHLTCTVSSVL